MRANFDPRRPIARPVVVPLRARRIPALTLTRLDAQALDELDEVILEFDTLGPQDQQARFASLVAELQRRGVVVHGSFTLGYDHDDEGCFARVVAWAEDQGLAGVELRLWTPTPGSDEARALARAGRLRHLDYARWDGTHVIVEPAAMAPETLQRGWAWALRRLGSLRSILRRRPRGISGLRHVLATIAPQSLARILARPGHVIADSSADLAVTRAIA